jgi:redox-sensing transcriptional repressor
MRYHKIPDEAICRLPIYLRGLLSLSKQGQESVSSRNLAELLCVNPCQVRKDFSYFGTFGTPGVGYNIEKLIKQIANILKINTVRKVALIGVGNLGSAVLEYPDFRLYGFDIAAAFDNDPKKIGKKIKNIKVEDVSNVHTLKKRKINFAIIAVPQNSAQKAVNALVEAGIKGILNFSPCCVVVPKKIKVMNIDICTNLACLAYYIPAS